jgi:hypothetical protein
MRHSGSVYVGIVARCLARSATHHQVRQFVASFARHTPRTMRVIACQQQDERHSEARSMVIE